MIWILRIRVSSKIASLAAASHVLPKLRLALLPPIFLAIAGTLNVSEPLTHQPDRRAENLTAFFETYHCPKPHHVQDYLRAADAYGLDYRLLPAISVRETTCGIAERQNNRWGYHPGRHQFHSVTEGIDFLARQLSENPPYAGKTLREKLYTYNPRRSYPAEVERIMRQIE